MGMCAPQQASTAQRAAAGRARISKSRGAVPTAALVRDTHAFLLAVLGPPGCGFVASAEFASRRDVRRPLVLPH